MKAKAELTGKNVFSKIVSAVKAEARTTATAMAKQQVKNIKTRTRWTAGADDSPMPPLTSSYGKYKKGRAIRNLRNSGQMMRDLKAVAAQSTGYGWESWVQFKDPRSAQVAMWNQRRARWFAFSPNDKRVLFRIWEGFSQRVGARLLGGAS